MINIRLLASWQDVVTLLAFLSTRLVGVFVCDKDHEGKQTRQSRPQLTQMTSIRINVVVFVSRVVQYLLCFRSCDVISCLPKTDMVTMKRSYSSSFKRYGSCILTA